VDYVSCRNDIEFQGTHRIAEPIGSELDKFSVHETHGDLVNLLERADARIDSLAELSKLVGVPVSSSGSFRDHGDARVVHDGWAEVYNSMSYINKTQVVILTSHRGHIGIAFGRSVAQFAHHDLLLGDARRLSTVDGGLIGGLVRSVGDEAEQEVASVVFNRTAEDLLVDRHGRSSLDTPKCVDGLADGHLSTTQNADFGCFIGRDRLTVWTRGYFDGDTSETDADGPDIAAEDIATIESLASTDSVIEMLKVDCEKRSVLE
jgi:hypothetical protein